MNRPAASGVLAERGPLAGAAIALALVGAVAGLQAATLTFMGQPLLCACGTVRFWTDAVTSAENSQQLTDWYSFSHVIHGILFYAGTRLVFPRMPVLARLAIALGLEVGWELLENSPPVIERYRQQALAQGYAGDSVLNSVGDTLACALGFLLAGRLPSWGSAALAIGFELFTGFMIRDNLTLNTLQLIYPIEAVSRWQLGGQ